MYPVVIDGERVRLRDLSPDDADVVWALSETEANLFFPEAAVRSREDVVAWLEHLERSARAAERIIHRFAVEIPASGELVGSARCDVEDPWDAQGSIGYAIAPRHRRHGLGREAAELALAFGFDELNLHRIEALVEPSNEPSRRIALALGMRIEGVLRERFRSGEAWSDAVVFALTAAEWREGR